MADNQPDAVRDDKGGTYGTVGSEKKNDENSPEGFDCRKGPLGPTNGRREGNGN